MESSSFFDLYGSNKAIAEYKKLGNSGIYGGKVIPPANEGSKENKTAMLKSTNSLKAITKISRAGYSEDLL